MRFTKMHGIGNDISAKYPWELHTLTSKVHFTRQRTPLSRTANDHNTTDNQKPRAPTHRPSTTDATPFQPSPPGWPINRSPFKCYRSVVRFAVKANAGNVTPLQDQNNIDNPENRRSGRR